jgi:hypothetical protein
MFFIKDFALDKPFLFIIKETQTGTTFILMNILLGFTIYHLCNNH